VSIKKVSFAIAFTSAVLSLAFFVGELAARWFILGGPRPALRSLFGQQNIFVPDPDLGFKLNPAATGVNSLGIRHDEISTVKPPDSFRVFVIGDSVAFDSWGFVRHLSEEFHKARPGATEVINASIPGFTTYQEMVLLERDLLPLHPDLVILQYCLNDNYKFLHFIDDSGRWLLTRDAEKAVGFEHHRLLAAWTRGSFLIVSVRIGLADLGTLTGSPFVWDGRPDFYAAWQDASWTENEAYLAGMKDRLDSIGARFVIVLVPFEPQLTKEALEADRLYTLKPQRRLMEISARHRIPYLDLFPIFEAHREEKLYRDKIHLTERGHRLVADQLLAFLKTVTAP
jgi:lysophospholipase L1-like esterase